MRVVPLEAMVWLVSKSGVSQQMRGGSLGQRKFGAGKWRTCPVVTVARGPQDHLSLWGISLHRNIAHVAFLFFQVWNCSDAKAWHWEVLFPSRLLPTSLVEERDAGLKIFRHRQPYGGFYCPIEGSAASLQLL